MNWQYLLIVFVLAALVGGAALSLQVDYEILPFEFPQKPEIIDGVVMVRNIDRELILEKIEQGKEFLYRMMDEQEKGFHKYYYALDDTFEERLHTVYSASIIYTFLYAYDSQKDEEILKQLSGWGNFLLKMQSRDVGDKRYGAFHYSYYLKTKEKEQKFVVGTAALSIFTLLRMYDLTGDLRYLDSAKLAGDWLLTMQEEDGSMKPYTRYSDGKWLSGSKESLLYNGQTLSSLSKLYQTTQDKRYYDAAQRIAQRFAEAYEKERGYIQGEYREKNPISNSWVVMSLMDFYRVSQEERYKNIVFELSEKVLANQKNDPNNLLQYGSWWHVYSTSGVGWISEVMVETYRFCQEQEKGNCDKYKDSALKAMRLLIQNTYSANNSSFLKNPARARGGVFWNVESRYVRTDSVCHALNGYLRLADDLTEGQLLSVTKL